MPRVDAEGNVVPAERSTILTGALVLACVAGALYLALAPNVWTDLPKAPTAAPASELPCVQEDCSERPTQLDCAFPGTGVCHKYRIVYERTCVCTRRAAP